jgi:steroid delta-isomerase-like uncharacterized protein
MSIENKALIHRWFDEVWNQGSAAAIAELMAPVCAVHGLAPVSLDAAGFMDFYRMFRETFPDVHVRIDDIISEGNIVAARYSATGTHRGNGLGFAATNLPVSFTGMVFVRVENGKLVEGWNNYDQLGMMQRLGVV